MPDASSHAADPSVRQWPVFPFVRNAAILAGISLALAGVSSGTMILLDHPIFATLNALAAGLCTVTALLALIPVAALSRAHPHGAAQGFMIGILVRMLTTASVVLVLIWQNWEHARAFSYFVAGWYMVVLIIEVKLVSSHALAHSAAGATGPGIDTRSHASPTPDEL
jgi:hypothetical protein